ncbi:hypothetical protein BGZ95_002214 [Linnemannia exigua]|uniref:Uncharacterized protein n=1 Tax=Linnemannia exigua TaxID=604196 RepID=A0AAD4D6D4_9FUNG|nr:hypothetical protein BGZ95_002214 [Linnemannia exigua]
MKFSLKAAALSALVASTVLAAPIEKRDANSDRIAACFVGLIFTGSWPGSCKAAISVDLGLIRSIAINQMTMDFTTANPWAPTMSSNSVVATMLSIPGITLPIDSVRQHVIVIDNNVQLGAFDTPWSAANVKGATMTTAFTTSALNVFPDAKAAFSNFVSSLSTKASHPVTLKGAVDAKLNLGIFGHLTIPGIGFKAVVPFKGLDNLKNTKFVYAVEMNPSIDGNIYLASIVTINNPSALTLSLGDVSFDASNNGERIGSSSIKKLTLVPGDNKVLSFTTLEARTLPAAQKFVDNLSSLSQTMSLAGFAGSSTNPALNGGLKDVRTGIVVPGNFEGSTMSQAPYKNWSLKVSAAKVATVTATFQSPYYGYPYEFVKVQPEFYEPNARASGMSSGSNYLLIWSFSNNIAFKVSGTGTVTVSFEVGITKQLSELERTKFEDVVKYAKANGKILVDIDMSPILKIDGDGVERIVDWTSANNKLGPISIAVGDDFANVLL